MELWKTAHVFGACGKSVNKHGFPFINAFSTGGESGFPQFHGLVLEYFTSNNVPPLGSYTLKTDGSVRCYKR